MTKVAVQVEVTADDIGTPGVWEGEGLNTRCMLDRAYDHTFQPGTVRQMFASAYRNGHKGLADLPERARLMREAWDFGKEIDPFTFTLLVPEEWMEDENE